jgi:hypothetical protein
MSRFANVFSATARGPAAFGRALVAGFALAAAASAPASAQTTDRPVIARIHVKVDGRPAGPELAALVALREGDPFSLKAVDQALRQIFQSAEYSDVQVLRSGEELVELTFVLTRRLTVRSVRVVAGAELPQKRLREGLADAAVGGVFIPERLPLAVAELKLRLRDEGYFEAAVDGRADRCPSRSSTSPSRSRWRRRSDPSASSAPAWLKELAAAQDREVNYIGALQAGLTVEGPLCFSASDGRGHPDERAGRGDGLVTVVRQRREDHHPYSARPDDLIAPIWEEVFENG